MKINIEKEGKIEPHYVTFNQAKLLKEKGFDELVRSHYKNGSLIWSGALYNWNGEEAQTAWTTQVTSAPEQWQVTEWLYKKYNIWIEIRRNNFFNEIRFQAYINDKPLIGNLGGYVSQETPQEAYSAAFDYILTNLI